MVLITNRNSETNANMAEPQRNAFDRMTQMLFNIVDVPVTLFRGNIFGVDYSQLNQLILLFRPT